MAAEGCEEMSGNGELEEPAGSAIHSFDISEPSLVRLHIRLLLLLHVHAFSNEEASTGCLLKRGHGQARLG